MNIKERVKASLKWKESAKKCAKKLGITEAEYLLLRSEIRAEERAKALESLGTGMVSVKEDMDKGTKSIEAISLSQPQSPEDLEKLFTFDKTQWKLSSYWSKQTVGGKWLVSALITRIKQEESTLNDFKRVVEEHSFTKVECDINVPDINTSIEDPTCAVISMQDIHVGKLDMDSVDTTEKDFKETVSKLVYKAYHSHNLDKIIFVLGGDLLNMDTFLGTTTSGTPVENSMSAYDAYKKAFDLMSWSVLFLKNFCNTLEVVYIPGNHSRLSEAHIAYALSKSIEDPNILWNVEYETRKVVTYGNSMLCFEHGDFDTKKSFFVFATEFASQWGQSIYRTLYTGHFHKERTTEYITRDETNGFTIKILPSLSRTDRFHHNGKWTNNKRGGIIQFHSLNNGCTGEFSHFLN